MTEEIRQIQPADDEVSEEWLRDGDDITGLYASRWVDGGDWPWQVTVGAAEFIREEPLESRMREAVMTALRAVPGVTDVVEEDRELWIVAGTPTGEALLRGAAGAIDPMADELRAHLEQLG